jgi:hypothetical protein
MREFDVTLQFCLAHLIRDVKFLMTLPGNLTMLDCLAPVQVADTPGRLVSPVRPSCRAPAPSRLHSPKALRPPLAFSAVSGSSALDGTDAG